MGRDAEEFQKPISRNAVQAICRRTFGDRDVPVAATELEGGLYNTTYRLDFADRDPVILRVAPEPSQQFQSEHELMRNEYASLPWLSPVAELLPAVVAVDWSHEILDRDYMIQTHLPGRPARELLGRYPRSTWPALFTQLGSITSKIHAISGPHFGPVTGSGYGTWSAAIVAALDTIAADIDSIGLDSTDLRTVSGIARDQRNALDEITEPRMLAGDLWTANLMLADNCPAPTIAGIHDLDRTWWGDPDADWTIRMAKAKNDERTAIWGTYGQPDDGPAASIRALIYEARHLGAIRLERHRLRNTDGVTDTYTDMRSVLAGLG